jgi:hypothetical protein
LVLIIRDIMPSLRFGFENTSLTFANCSSGDGGTIFREGGASETDGLKESLLNSGNNLG